MRCLPTGLSLISPVSGVMAPGRTSWANHGRTMGEPAQPAVAQPESSARFQALHHLVIQETPQRSSPSPQPYVAQTLLSASTISSARWSGITRHRELISTQNTNSLNGPDSHPSAL
ncbi:hypothetical protein V2G26_019677 [Clonostachys chloroleuca]